MHSIVKPVITRSLRAALVLSALAVTAAAQNAQLQSLDEYVQRAMKDHNVPGVAIAIVKDDKVVYAKGFGVREVGKPDPVTPNTVFAIGSASKAFTGVTMAMLVDEGKIKWNDPVTKYLPYFQLYDPQATREATVTDLLTHRLGLERADSLWYATERSREEVVRQVRFVKPSWSVRSEFGYQNIMYIAAGEILPAVTGKTWDAFVQERIFDPLGMKTSTTTVRDLSRFAEVASPHIFVDGKMEPVKWRNIDNAGPAGSINSNVMDMAQWLRFQLGKGAYEGKSLLSKERLTETHSPYSIIPDTYVYRPLYAEAHLVNYGYGWFLSDYRGRKLVEHGGAIDGMRTAVSMIPEENLGVVVLTNMNGSILSMMLANKALDAFLGGTPRDWSALGLGLANAAARASDEAQQKVIASRVANTKPSLETSEYAGDYQSVVYGKATVALKDGQLVITRGANFNGVLKHWHYDTFESVWGEKIQGKSFVVFTLNKAGAVDALSFDGLGEFKRVNR